MGGLKHDGRVLRTPLRGAYARPGPCSGGLLPTGPATGCTATSCATAGPGSARLGSTCSGPSGLRASGPRSAWGAATTIHVGVVVIVGSGLVGVLVGVCVPAPVGDAAIRLTVSVWANTGAFTRTPGAASRAVAVGARLTSRREYDAEGKEIGKYWSMHKVSYC